MRFTGRVVCCLLALGLLVSGMPTPWTPAGRPELKPVIMIPGNGGCQLEAKLNKHSVVQAHCPAKSDWFRLWLDVWQLMPSRVECWVDNIKLVYNSTARTSHNSPGVETRTVGWGSTGTMEYLDPSWSAWIMGNAGSYLAPIVQELTKWGYERGINIFGAPYDFRYAPHSQSEYFEKLKSLVEEAYHTNGERKVVLLSHSMGGLFGQYFLHHQSQQWKDSYIDSMVGLNIPWKGTVLLNQVLTSGYNWGVDIIDALVFRTQQRSFESAMLMVPHRDYWGKDEPIVMTPQKNYTAHDYHQYFTDIKYDVGHSIYDEVTRPSYDVSHPGVTVHCFYTSGIPTPAVISYKEGEFPNGKPQVLMGEGDGTVNLRSLTACQDWMDDDESVHQIHSKHFPDAQHNDILTDPRVFDAFETVLFQPSEPP